MLRDSFLFRLRPRHLSRYRRIVEVFAYHGFGAVFTQVGLDRTLNVPRRFFRRGQTEIARIPPAVRLRLALEELGPTFVKLGQIASTRPELVPPSVLEELSNLQDNVPPAPWEEMQPVIEEELGQPIHEVFLAFDPTPIAAASLAQVYAALLLDHTEVVVKVQRPDVEKTVGADLEILSDIASLVSERLPGFVPFNPVDMVDEFALALREELDYRREGRNADTFRRNFEGEDYLYVPLVYWDYSTKYLMVQERIRGLKFDDFEAIDAAGYDRDGIALTASRIFIKEVLEDGFFHADPHPGNLLIMENEVIAMIDFGTVGYLDQRDKTNLIRLYTSVIQLDAAATVDHLIRMGVADPAVNTIGLERELQRLLRNYVGLPLKEISASELMAEVVPIIYEYRLRIPSDYWLLIKTLVIMEGVGKQMAPDFDVFAVSAPYVRRFLIHLALPTTWGPDVLRTMTGWAQFFGDLPQQTNRLLTKLDRGQLEIRIEDPATNNLSRQVNRAANRLIQAVLIGSLIVGLSLLLPSIDLTWPWGLITWVIVIALFVTLITAFWLLWSMWRSGRSNKL